MQVIVDLIRHGKTKGNLERRYIGSTDEALAEIGFEELLQMRKFWNDGQGCSGTFGWQRLMSSPMKRCVQTAEILFPDMQNHVIQGLQETAFGPFEGKTYEELKEDPDYRCFVDSRGSEVPAGAESSTRVGRRIREAFENSVSECLRKYMEIQTVRDLGTEEFELDDFESEDFESHDFESDDFESIHLIYVVHGGTILHLMHLFGEPAGDFYDYLCPNGGGIRCRLEFSYRKSMNEASDHSDSQSFTEKKYALHYLGRIPEKIAR